MKFLIISHSHDVHATAVAFALFNCGHEVVLWSAPRIAGEQRASLLLKAPSSGWIVEGNFFPRDFFDAIWLRRRGVTSVSEMVHDDDRDFVYRENRLHFEQFWVAAKSPCRWIHEPSVAQSAEHKILQLRLAQEVGLSIPSTLVSNDRSEILSFIAENASQGHETVYKTFSGAGWKDGAGTKIKHTSLIDAKLINGSDLVEVVPGIFQARIEKQLEVRANFFGEESVSVAIRSQDSDAGRLDWRSIFDLSGRISLHQLPNPIVSRCRELMRLMRITVACIDFIIDRHGSYHFLEVNQQGQFLWIEERCPEAYLLEIFIRFLTGTKGVFPDPIRYSDIVANEDHGKLGEEFKNRGVVVLGKFFAKTRSTKRAQ